MKNKSIIGKFIIGIIIILIVTSIAFHNRKAKEIVLRGTFEQFAKLRMQITTSSAPYIEVVETAKWMDAQISPQVDTTRK